MSFLSNFKNTLQNRLAGPWMPLVFAIIAVLLVMGSVKAGWQFDDFMHRYKIENLALYSDHGSSIMELFTFTDGDSQENQKGMDMGLLPWWTDTGVRISFFRPLAALTHWIDYQLWPENPLWMHVHSMFWFGAMVFVAALLYRRLLTPAWIAGLAALLFALDDAHGVPVGWLANRYVLVAAFFGFLALYCHDRWRRDGRARDGVLASALFILALFCGESALAIGAYVFSYELFVCTGSLRKRALAVLPYTVLAGGWYILYAKLGYGTQGSGLYTDPGGTPMVFLKELVERIPLLLHGQWFLPDGAAYAYIAKPWAYVVLACLYLLLACLVTIFFPLMRKNRVFRFWMLGMLMSLLPVCATYPSNRSLVFVGLGAMGMLAQFLAGWLEKPAWWPASRIGRLAANVFAVVFIFVHFIAAPLMLPMTATGMERFNRTSIERPIVDLSEKETLSGKTLVFINPPITFGISYIPLFCDLHGIEPPAHSYVLACGAVDYLDIERVGSSAIEIEPADGFISKQFDKLFRGPVTTMTAGQQVRLSGMTAQVLSMTDDQRPQRVRFTFPRPLEDATLAFYEWRDNGFAPFRIPQIGQIAHLDKVKLKRFKK